MWTQWDDYAVRGYLAIAFTAFLAGILNPKTRKATLKITAIIIGAIVIIASVSILLFVIFTLSPWPWLGIPIIGLLGFGAFVLIRKILANPLEDLRQQIPSAKEIQNINNPVSKKVWVIFISIFLVGALMVFVLNTLHSHHVTP
jgi:hypothetical protein